MGKISAWEGGEVKTVGKGDGCLASDNFFGTSQGKIGEKID